MVLNWLSVFTNIAGDLNKVVLVVLLPWKQHIINRIYSLANKDILDDTYRAAHCAFGVDGTGDILINMPG